MNLAISGTQNRSTGAVMTNLFTVSETFCYRSRAL